MGFNNNEDHINEVISEISEPVPLATVKDLESKIRVDNQTAYIIADAFTGNPYQLLGQILEVRKTNGECPTSLANKQDLNFEFTGNSVTGFKKDEQSKLSKPELRGSIIVNKDLALQAGFLNFLSTELDQKSSFSLMIMDQAKGLVDFQDNSWNDAIKKWKEDI